VSESVLGAENEVFEETLIFFERKIENFQKKSECLSRVYPKLGEVEGGPAITLWISKKRRSM